MWMINNDLVSPNRNHPTPAREETDVTTAIKNLIQDVLRFLWHFSTTSLAGNVTVINRQLVKDVRKCQALDREGNSSE